jgi:division protein CdvB (Snf7/Vps24/ESCRT-III family)
MESPSEGDAMPHFHPDQERHDALIEAIGHAAHTIATAIEKGFIHMADAQTAALADLAAAVTGIADSVSAEITALQAAVTKAAQNAANMQPDDSAAIEAQVTKLNDLNAALKASVAPAAPATPASPSTGS